MIINLEQKPEHYVGDKISITIHYKPSARYDALDLKGVLLSMPSPNKPVEPTASKMALCDYCGNVHNKIMGCVGM